MWFLISFPLTANRATGQQGVRPACQPGEDPGLHEHAERNSMPAVRRTALRAMSRLPHARSFASTVSLGRLVLKGKIDCEVRPGPGRAVDVDRAAQGLDPVGEPGQARTTRRIGA